MQTLLHELLHASVDASLGNVEAVEERVVDALDAMTSSRPYRAGMPLATALQIIDKVLEPVGGATNLLPTLSAPRAYCVQYRETDLEFFLRLCSEEGIIHFWRHDHLKHTLVLSGDTTGTAPALDLSVDVVKQRLHRGRLALRKRLAGSRPMLPLRVSPSA
mgnify:CR=1 FL=1